ncbi:MAG: ribosomal protein S18-alanine N-acetyltransferase [Dehalococcoidia bacterium]|nr:ribosomal protein S18-alanine N-acetyltransferase [Dehalococcoidia bacterium]
MTADDIAQVVEIERESFPSIWPQTAYRRELQNKLARYTVISEPDGPEQDEAQPATVWSTLRRIVGNPPSPAHELLLGFIGVWMMPGEAHIVTVAVREDRRRSGIGQRLLIAVIEQAQEDGQELVTLEVRRSNDVAQRLYEKYGFQRAGLRVRYYTDNNEDAVIMTTPDVSSPSYRELFERLRRAHQEACPDLWD